MIKAEDLRIGNFVVRHEEITQVKGVIESGAWFEDNECVDFRKLQTVYLTSSILESCGFELRNKISNRWRKYVNNVDSECMFLELLEVGNDKPYRVTYTYNTDVFLNRKIHYLHELQNLYFALTGKELQIKIPSLSTSHTS